MSTRRRTGTIVFAVGALTVALLLAALVSPFASKAPDGLNKVAADHGFGHKAKTSAVAGSPLANYSVKHVDDKKVSKGLSGILGVVITMLVAGVLFGALAVVVRRRTGSGLPSAITGSG